MFGTTHLEKCEIGVGGGEGEEEEGEEGRRAAVEDGRPDRGERYPRALVRTP